MRSAKADQDNVNSNSKSLTTAARSFAPFF